MSKSVHFSDDIPEHKVLPPQTVQQKPASLKPPGIWGLSLWWILLIILVAIVVGYFGWKCYGGKSSETSETI